MTLNQMYRQLKDALYKEVSNHQLFKEKVCITCTALSPEEAIGTPDHKDYPIIKGKEVLVEAEFLGSRGQAFTDEFEIGNYSIEELLDLELDTNSRRASFISGLNAVYRHLGLIKKTIHCKDEEPLECALELLTVLGKVNRILLVGYQPRFAEVISANYSARVVDLDDDNIGKHAGSAKIESAEKTREALQWCDLIFATGSTIVNGTIIDFVNQDKPVIYYGVTISAAAKILKFNSFCHKGR